MRHRRLITGLVFVAGLALGAGTAAWAQAQRASSPSSGTFRITTDTAGNVVRSTKGDPIALSDEPLTLPNDALGLRVTGTHHGRVVGTLVAKIDGKWVEVQFAPQDSFAGR
jgi:hypothetical protein